MFISRMALVMGAGLFSPEGDGGSAGGDGGKKPDDSGGFTEEQAKQIANIANSALTSQIKRLNLEGKITDAIGGLKLDEKFTALTEAIAGKKKDDPAPDPKEKPTVDPVIAKQLKELADKLEASEKRAAEAVEAARLADETRQFDAARQSLFEGLAPHAEQRLHDVWVDHLVHHKRLKVEDGKTLLEVEHAPARGLPKQKEFLPLADALPKLLELEDSKRFMKAPQGGNAGQSRGPSNGASGGGNTDPFAAALAKVGGTPADLAR